jgi:hypothetical protein
VGFELRRYFDDFDVEHVELASDIAEDEIGPRPPKIGAKLPKGVKPSVFAMRMSAFGDKADMTFRGLYVAYGNWNSLRELPLY